MTVRSLRTRNRWVLLAAILAVIALGALAGGASAHVNNASHGEITWHDSEDGEAQQQTELRYPEGGPVELECEFWVKGYNMSQPTGSIVVEHNFMAQQRYTEVAGNWTGEPNATGGGWDFEAGPFTLDRNGSVAGFSVVGEETHADKEHQGDYNHTTEDHRIAYTACEEDWDDEGEDDQRECPPEDGNGSGDGSGDESGAGDSGSGSDAPPCPENLSVDARQSGAIHLEWSGSAQADTYHVYRSAPGEGYEQVATVETTSYLDEETQVETTYQYRVTAVDGSDESVGCNVVEATAIPFFEGLTVALAAIGSVGAIAAIRYKR